MTVSSSTNRVSYSGNGSLTTFAYTFKIFDQDDLTVILRASNGTETVQTITTHYTVTNVGNASGGNIEFVTAPSSTETVVILRAQPLTQGLDLVPNDPFPAQSLEEALDKLVFMSQKHEEELSRAIKASRTNVIQGSEFTISASDRANKVFAFDSSGDVSITSELGVYRGEWAAGVAYNQRDLVKDGSNDNIYQANTAHTSSGTTPLSANPDIAKWDLIVDAAAAAASAAAALASETAAAASEAAAAASEAASAASEAAAALSETNAAASEAAAAASYDNFDDRYLGAKSTTGGNPTVDNDGDALIDGALFFDTTNNVMMVYNLGTTTWLRTTPTATDQANINAVNADASDIGVVATNIGSVNTVATNINEVIAVANDLTEAISEVETVANDLNEATSEIETVAASIANVDAVGTNITAVTGVNAISTEIVGVNNISTEVVGVHNNSTNINAVYNNSTNINTLAGLNTELAALFAIRQNIVDVDNNEANINAVRANQTNINSVAAIDSDVSAVSNIATDVSIVADNISGIADFADVYIVSATQPSTAIEGTLWFDTTNDIMKVYDGNAFQNAGSSVNGTVESKEYTVGTPSGTYTNSLTTFPATYDANYIHVWLNGVKLVDGVDFTATDGANVVLSSAATNGDVVSIVAYGTFLLADHYSRTAVDALIDDVETLALAGI